MKPKTSLLLLLVGIISATSFLAPGSAQEEPSQAHSRAKAVSVDEAVQMLKQHGIIDPNATGKLDTSAMSEIGKEYKENPIAAISEEFLYHFMMYKDGVENLSYYPYIDKIFELYKRTNTEQQGKQVSVLRKLPVQCLEAFAAAGAKIANYPACRDNIFAVDPTDPKLVMFLCTHCAKTSPDQVNVADANGWTPLMIVASYSPADACAEACRLLIQAGADVNAKENDGWTPLMVAARCSTADVCRLLIQAGADVNAKMNDGWTPLMLAAQFSTAEACRILIQAGADVNAKSNDGCTPLILAAQNSTAEACRILIQAGADVNVEKNDGWTPLMLAARRSTAEACRILIQAGAKVDEKNNDESTALMLATWNTEHPDVCGVLLDAGASVHTKDKDGWTPLMWAAEHSSATVCERLIKLGADVNAKTNDGWTPLMFAARYSTAEACRILIQAGAKVDEKNHDSTTALMLTACNTEHPDVCGVLLDAGASVHAKNKYGSTPLTWAAWYCPVAICECLIKLGANVNAKNNNGWTPLIPAVLCGDDDRENHADARVLLVPIGDGEQHVSLPECAQGLNRELSNPLKKEELIKDAREISPNAKLNYQEEVNIWRMLRKYPLIRKK